MNSKYDNVSSRFNIERVLYLFPFQTSDRPLQIVAFFVRDERMTSRIVVNENAPHHEPNYGYNTEEVKHVRPTAGYVLNNKSTQGVCENITDLYACIKQKTISRNKTLRVYYTGLWQRGLTCEN